MIFRVHPATGSGKEETGRRKFHTKVQYMHPITKDRDDSVAVVIGTLLTFVIVVSLVSAFILWYIPSNGQSNDLKFVAETENSFVQLQNELGNGTAYPNQFVVQSFPIGIQGTPPFSGNSNTLIQYINSTAYRINMSYNMYVTFSYGGSQHVYNFHKSSNSSGVIETFTSTPFITPEKFCFTGDTISVRQSGSNYSQFVGTLPLSFYKNSTGRVLQASEFGVYGKNTSFGGYGATIVTLQYSMVNENDYFDGENVTIYNPDIGGYTPAVVTNITLTSFHTNITSPAASSWNSTLEERYGLQTSITSNNKVGVKWMFSQFPLEAGYKNQTFSISNTGVIYLYSVNLNEFNLNLLEL